MKEILDRLGIHYEEEDIKGNIFNREINNYNTFNNLYNILDNSYDLVRDSNESYMNEDDMYILFIGDNCSFELTGSLEKDTYQIKGEMNG